ncbi:MAG: CoA transferase [Actinomycetia bacterium]|nr:CoA transferase [Actinomycetes bacterium]MCP5034793.1 CoA transferase [Actinomycetes bacterium]
MQVLDGVRVIDFGRYIAGPFCATLLGDLGADVIRVERREGGEDRWVTPVTADGVGALFLQIGRNKRSLTLDVTSPEGAEIVAELVATADIVVANLPPQTLETMGLDYDSLRAIKPDIILTTVNAFGSGGPISTKVGFDGLAQSMSGNLHMTGETGVPTRAAVPYADFSTAAFSALATMAALRHRDQTGEGQILEGALLRSALTLSNAMMIEQDLLGVDREASLNRSQTAGPSDVFQTKDGWVMCSVLGAYQFDRWCQMLGAPELVNDERFKDDLGRGDNSEALSARMAAWCAERTNAQALDEMATNKIPAGPVYTPQQALDDEHIAAIGAMKQVDYPTADHPPRLVDFPVTMSASPGAIAHRAPELGEHTDEILTELGYDQTLIAELRTKHVI